MKKNSDNPDSGRPLTRSAKKFNEKFEKLRLALKEANEADGDIDAAFADLASHLTSSEKEFVSFLSYCTDEQFRAVLLVLDDVASEFASSEFLQVLKDVQARFPKYDLTSSMDVAAYAIAERLNEDFLGKNARKGVQKLKDSLYDSAAAGDADALFHLALMYYFGSGVQQNYGTAKDLANKALDAGCERAVIFRDLPGF